MNTDRLVVPAAPAVVLALQMVPASKDVRPEMIPPAATAGMPTTPNGRTVRTLPVTTTKEVGAAMLTADFASLERGGSIPTWQSPPVFGARIPAPARRWWVGVTMAPTPAW